MPSHKSYDVIIIGGGPAGATAAAVLAMKGRRVAVIEKESFPRYHVGESLIPYCYFPLSRIGMIDRLKASSFTRKYSVQFASIKGRMSQPFYFFEHMDHEASQSWQVIRSEFDAMMLENASEKGADIFQGYRVREAVEQDGAVTGVIAQNGDGTPVTFLAPMTIDASGRNGFFARRNGWRIPDDNLQKIAIWTYFRGAKRDSGYDEGATTVAYIPAKGWFWYIPLPDDIVSVGVVADKDYLYRDGRDVQEIFHREIGSNKWIEKHLATGKQIKPCEVTGDYSYRSRYCAADGLVLTGDAFGFLDPVFSTGMWLAFMSGEMAADAVDGALSAQDFSAAQFSEYGEGMCAAIEAMRKLVYAFYDPDFTFSDLLKKYPHLASDVTDCLIGNVSVDFTELFTAIEEFAAVPDALPHGRPLIRDTASCER